MSAVLLDAPPTDPLPHGPAVHAVTPLRQPLPASGSLEALTRRRWDAVVVGAGPAGALAARQLALVGVDVLLVDKAMFPRWKVCGCCLNLRALATLEAVGLGKLVERLGAVRLDTFHLAGWQRQATMSLPGGAALSRTAFDAALVEAALTAGTTFLPGTHVALGESMDHGRTLNLRQGERTAEVEAALVLAANGLGGKLLAGEKDSDIVVSPGSRIGAGTIADEAPNFYQSGTIYMACGAAGYVGLVRLEDGRLDIAAAFDAEEVRRAGGLGDAAAAILNSAGFPAIDRLEALPWRGTPPLTRRASRLGGHRAFVLGDAAGYIEPFTGEGMAWALASGAGVAPFARRAIARWEADLVTRWSVQYRRTVARRQRVCRVVARTLRSPRLTRLLIRSLGWLPALAHPLIRYLNASASVSPTWKGDPHESCHPGSGNGPARQRHHASGGR